MRDRSPDGRTVASLVLHKFSRGGSDRVAAYLARGFAEAGVNVELLVFCSGGEVETILSRLIGDDIPIRYLSRRRGPRALDLICGLPALVRALHTSKPDIVISTANNTALVSATALILSRLRRARLILKTTNPIATSRHTGVVRWIRRWSYRLIFRRTEAVWTLSAAESDEMAAAFPTFRRLFQDIANPYVTPAMLASAHRVAAPATSRTVISVARLTAQKRMDRLIKAFAHVRDQRARLLILGEGEDRDALEELVGRHGLGGRVSMPGYVDNVAQALHDADLFVLPSDYEGLPAAVLEAMAANCPVLATDCFPSARSLVGNAEGCAIIEHCDPRGLAALIDEHLAQPRPTRLRMLAERYSVANAVESHLQALGLTGRRSAESAQVVSA